MMNMTTTQNLTNAPEAMSERQIDLEFEKVAGALTDCPKRRVMIPKGAEPGDDVVEVGLNGRMFLMRRGEPVELPEPRVEVLEHAQLL